MDAQPQDDHTAGGEQTGHYPGSPCIKQMDIRRFLKDAVGLDGDRFKNMTFANSVLTDEPIDKMRLIRNKMVEARRAADRTRLGRAGTWRTP